MATINASRMMSNNESDNYAELVPLKFKQSFVLFNALFSFAAPSTVCQFNCSVVLGMSQGSGIFMTSILSSTAISFRG